MTWLSKRLALMAALAVCVASAASAHHAAASRKLATGAATSAATPRGSDGTGTASSEWLDCTPGMSHSAAMPAAGEDCAAVYDPVGRRMVLFGGKDDTNRNLDEVWTLDLERFEWRRIDIQGPKPPPSEDHTLIYDPVGRRMILFGGENGLTTGKTWSFDLQTYRWRDLTDTTGPVREDHIAIYDSRRKRMVVWGGRDNTGTIDYVNISDLFALDLDPASPTFEKWIHIPIGKERAPGRSDHAAIYDARRDRMVVFGGWDKAAKAYLDDTWTFTFAAPPDSGGEWKKVRAKLSHPPRRRHVVGVYDEAHDWFVVFGGFGDEGFLNDVWAFDLARDEWINITPGPQPRLDQLAIYDPGHQKLLLYGGDAHWARKFHDLWELRVRPEVSADSLR